MELKSEVQSMGSKLATLTEQIQGMQSFSAAPQPFDSGVNVQLPLGSTVALEEFENRLANDGSLLAAMVSSTFYRANLS